MVTQDIDLLEVNPDILDLIDVKGCGFDGQSRLGYEEYKEMEEEIRKTLTK